MTAIWFRLNLALALWGWIDAIDDFCYGLLPRFREREPEHQGFTEEFSIRDLMALAPEVPITEPLHLAVEPIDPVQAQFDLDPLSPWALAPNDDSETAPLFDSVWRDFLSTANFESLEGISA